MIKNDLQYRVARSTLTKFRRTLDQHDKITADHAAWARTAHKATVIGEIKKLESDIAEYERIKSGMEAAPPFESDL